MGLKANILSGYVSQAYVTVIGIVVLPVLLRYLGSEAYGLVGTFTMIQSFFGLLDFGLSSTVSRETARFQAGATPVTTYLTVLRALGALFFVVATLGCYGLVASAELFSTKWLNVEILPLNEVVLSVKLMGLAVALRWMTGFYRSVIYGTENLAWISVANSIVATLRFPVAVLILVYVGNGPVYFFCYQLFVAFFEFFLFVYKARKLNPSLPPGFRLSWSPLQLYRQTKSYLGFAAIVAFTSVVWVLTTQVDRLILSKFISLADFGYYSLAVMLAGGITLITRPVTSAITPRMARLHAMGDDSAVVQLYRRSTQWVAVVSFPTCLTLAFYSKEVLLLWTGNSSAANFAEPILMLYAIGNGILSVSSFPFSLQYAKGDLRLHLIGNFIFLLLLVPVIAFVAYKHGAIGAAFVWFFFNLTYFLVWTPLVHRRFFAGLHMRWLTCDLLPIAGIALIVTFFIKRLSLYEGWMLSSPLIVVASSSILSLAAAAMGSSHFRSRLFLVLGLSRPT